LTSGVPAGVDVAIIGGGPAGSATALSLRAHAPGLSVVLLESSSYDAVRIGETLPPAARPVLEHLGVWEAFRAQGHREVHGTAAAWGTSQPVDNDFLYYARGSGWHLDRASFDRMLAAEAESRGVHVLRDTPVTDAATLGARFLVDATGSSARFARQYGARSIAADHLQAFVRFFDHAPPGDPRTVVEAFEHGWWYTAGIPDGRRIAACMTDADLGRTLRLADAATWTAALRAMPLLGPLLRDAEPAGPVLVRPAESRRLDPVAGDTWLATGDAASTFDPLSSQGILKALRSGTFAAYAISDLLVKGDPTGLRRYQHFITEEFAAYTTTRTRYYAEEGRWKGSVFWGRRGE